MCGGVGLFIWQSGVKHGRQPLANQKEAPPGATVFFNCPAATRPVVAAVAVVVVGGGSHIPVIMAGGKGYPLRCDLQLSGARVGKRGPV